MKNRLDSVYYHNLLEPIDFSDKKQNIEIIGTIKQTQFYKASLQAGTSLDSHKSDQHVTILWLRGKAKFTSNNEVFTMHPGSMLYLTPETLHSVVSETDCIFLILKQMP